MCGTNLKRYDFIFFPLPLTISFIFVVAVFMYIQTSEWRFIANLNFCFLWNSSKCARRTFLTLKHNKNYENDDDDYCCVTLTFTILRCKVKYNGANVDEEDDAQSSVKSETLIINFSAFIWGECVSKKGVPCITIELFVCLLCFYFIQVIWWKKKMRCASSQKFELVLIAKFKQEIEMKKTNEKTQEKEKNIINFIIMWKLCNEKEGVWALHYAALLAKVIWSFIPCDYTNNEIIILFVCFKGISIHTNLFISSFSVFFLLF